MILDETQVKDLVLQLEQALEEGQTQRVEKIAHQLIEADVELATAYNALAISALEEEANYEAAKTYYELALASSPESATLHFNLAILYDQFYHQTDLAISYYEQAIALDATYVDAYIELIELLLEQNTQLEQAMTYANLAETLDEKNPRLLNNIGCLHLRIHQDYQTAVSYFERALLQTSNKALIAANLADAHVKLRQYEQAKHAYELSLSHQPDNALICHNFAHVLQHHLHDATLAKQMYLRAITLAPHEIQPYLGLKSLYLHLLKSPKEAAALLEDGLKHVTNTMRLELELADLYDVVLEDFDKAVYYYKKVLQQQPHHLTALNALAYLHVQVYKNYEAAIRYYESVLEVDPQTPITYVNLGHVYFLKLSNFDQALHYYNEAHERIKQQQVSVPYAAELYLNLGMLYDECYHQPFTALNYYEQAIGVKGNKKAEQRALRLYKKLPQSLHTALIS